MLLGNGGRVAAAVAVVAIAGCSLSAPPYVPADCADVTSLFAVRDVLVNRDHGCFVWVDETHGRVARSGAASAAIWTRRTEFGTAVMTSAVHTLGVGFLGPGGSEIAQTLRDPSLEHGVARVRLIDEDGIDSSVFVSPVFVLYNPAIPVGENGNGFADILPEHDFYLAVVDGQRLEDAPLLEVPGPLSNEGPRLYDPAMRADVEPTFAASSADALVLIMGYPADGHGNSGTPLCASVGRVLSDAEAVSAVVALAAAGDEEGGIAYDAEVEMIIEGSAAGGMSGGGVFDRDGLLVGVIVRATEAASLPQYVRAVRMTYVVSRLGGAFDGLAPEVRDAVSRYLEPGIQN